MITLIINCKMHNLLQEFARLTLNAQFIEKIILNAQFTENITLNYYFYYFDKSIYL